MNYEFRLFIMNFYSTVLSVKFSSLTRPGVSGSESGLWGNPRESEEARCSAEPALFSGCESNFGPRDHNNTTPKKTMISWWIYGFYGFGSHFFAVFGDFNLTHAGVSQIGGTLEHTHTQRYFVFFSGFPHFKTPLIEHLEIRRCGSSSHFRPWMFDPSHS